MFRAHFEVVRSCSLSKGRSSHPGDLFLWKSEDREPGVIDERIEGLGAVADSLEKVCQQSRDFVDQDGATVDSRSALHYFPCCFDDRLVGFRLC